MTPLLLTRTKVLSFVLFCLSTQPGNAQPENSAASAENKHINFYIYTRQAGSKLDLLGKSILLRARIKSAFSKNELHVIVAENSRQVADRIMFVLNKQHAMIGNIWIDSHGLYWQGYSSFHIGSDEFNYKNIHDTAYTKALQDLSFYSDNKTNFGLGSCYGGATFTFPGTAKAAAGRMNGDSLMMGLGHIFIHSTIYGSESWVMAKPGILNNRYGFAGYPLGKHYRNILWKPVWERLGKWNRYNSCTGVFEPVNTVSLTKRGQITVRLKNYQQLEKGQKAVRKNVLRLV